MRGGDANDEGALLEGSSTRAGSSSGYFLLLPLLCVSSVGWGMTSSRRGPLLAAALNSIGERATKRSREERAM